jgi:hypothetical protein
MLGSLLKLKYKPNKNENEPQPRPKVTRQGLTVTNKNDKRQCENLYGPSSFSVTKMCNLNNAQAHLCSCQVWKSLLVMRCFR